jgi:hypothetical protein
METTYQSAGQAAQCSSTAPAAGPRDGSITVGELIDRRMLAYTGKDESLPQRLDWWRGKIGHLKLIEVDDDTIFRQIEAMTGRPVGWLDAERKDASPTPSPWRPGGQRTALAARRCASS